MNPLFVTVSDRLFFTGTLAAVNSLLHFHPTAEIAVISSGKFNEPLTSPQISCLCSAGVAVYSHDRFERPGRVLGAWQLKAYAVNDLSQDRDMVVLFDSDLFFCSNVQDILDACLQDGKFRGGQDGAGPKYDESYRSYGIQTPAWNRSYMSTSCCFVPLTSLNRRIISRWAECSDQAVYGPQKAKIYPGHGDQGVLNAILYAEALSHNVELLPNELWSQHWRFESDIIDFEQGRLINCSAKNARQRCIHCGGSHKFWSKRNSELRRTSGQNQRWAYASFLDHLFLGRASVWSDDPLLIIPGEQSHLFVDLVFYHQLIRRLRTNFGEIWPNVGHELVNRCVSSANVARMMTLSSASSMDRYVMLARRLPDRSSIVEVGSYLGGSIVTLAIALLEKNLTLYSIDSFMGNGNNAVDGLPLPSLEQYIHNTKTVFPFLNINSIQLPSRLAASDFAEEAIDMVFIDGDHRTASVMDDIRTWKPKLRRGGILAGDDVSWASVRAALDEVQLGYDHDGKVWWTTV